MKIAGRSGQLYGVSKVEHDASADYLKQAYMDAGIDYTNPKAVMAFATDNPKIHQTASLLSTNAMLIDMLGGFLGKLQVR